MGEAVTHDRASPVLELPNVAGSEAVCKDNLGRFVMLVLCITDGVAVVVTAIMSCAVVCDMDEGDPRGTEICDKSKIIGRTGTTCRNISFHDGYIEVTETSENRLAASPVFVLWSRTGLHTCDGVVCGLGPTVGSNSVQHHKEAGEWTVRGLFSH